MRPPAQVPPPSPTPAPPRSSPLVTLLLPAGLFSVPLSSPLLDVVGGFQQERSGLPVWLPSLSAQLWVPVLWSGVGSRCQDASHLACPLPSADGGGGGGEGWGGYFECFNSSPAVFTRLGCCHNAMSGGGGVGGSDNRRLLLTVWEAGSSRSGASTLGCWGWGAPPCRVLTWLLLCALTERPLACVSSLRAPIPSGEPHSWDLI